jgi:hypothetical protein
MSGWDYLSREFDMDNHYREIREFIQYISDEVDVQQYHLSSNLETKNIISGGKLGKRGKELNLDYYRGFDGNLEKSDIDYIGEFLEAALVNENLKLVFKLQLKMKRNPDAIKELQELISGYWDVELTEDAWEKNVKRETHFYQFRISRDVENPIKPPDTSIIPGRIISNYQDFIKKYKIPSKGQEELINMFNQFKN